MSTELVTTNPEAVQEFSAFGSEPMFVSAQRMAKALSSSTIVPTTYQGDQNIGNCVIALEISNRIGMTVLAVMQNLYLVHGKPGWSAQFLISCVNASKKFTPLRYKMTGTKGKDDWGCIAWATDKTGEELKSPEVTIEMAKKEGWFGKSGSKWQTMPELMLHYRAATFFARLYAPELTMGIQTTDELTEVIDVDSDVTVGSPEPVKPTFKQKKSKETAVEATVTTSTPTSAPVPETVVPMPKPAPKPKVAQQESPAPTPEPAKQEATTPEPPATEGESPALQDLRAAMVEGAVTEEQVLRFAHSKKAVKDGSDPELGTLDDILGSKVGTLAKMIRTKGQAWKEMTGAV